MPPLCYRTALRLAIAAILVTGLAAGDTSAQRRTDAVALNELARQLDASRKAKQPPQYFELLRSTEPAQQALNQTEGIRLMYLRENGAPAYYTTQNLNAALTIRTYDVWPLGVGNGIYSLTGSTTAPGELAIWDGGNVRATHVEFGGRVTLLDPASPYGVIFHATHVAGTMIAGGVNVSARGGSYAAPLHSYDWDDDVAEMAAAAAAGLQVSNHSYGYITGWYNSGSWYWFGDRTISNTQDYGFGYYDTSAEEYDQIAYNAPYYLICVAAGNERDDHGPGAATHFHLEGSSWVSATDLHPSDAQKNGYDTVSWFSTAKNILCVGACNDIPSGYVNPASVVPTAFTSWGPTDDGRIKPDVVANGASLFSSSNNTDGAYANASGTSMATPNTSGSINLIAQDYETQKGASPWASTLKALVVNAADEAGPADGPDYMNGWGLVNVRRMADIVHGAPNADLGVLEASLSNGETDTYFFESSSPQDIRVTIAWTDPAGNPLSPSVDNPTPMLVNDLDLRVQHVVTATTTLPWHLDVAAPANNATQADNTVDNVEQVDIDTAPTGIYQVTVTHKGSLDPAGTQDYSLVYRGMHETQATPVAASTPKFTLSSPYPSPVTGTATIDFTMGQAGRVSIAVYDVAGRRVASLLDTSTRSAGPGSVVFNARNVPSGVYFVKMQTSSETITKKITVVK
ncbi:MAG TPA: S8 family serine peptidase [Candidatus Krumholzibacteria bacterium]|nr:S8 family serine peptidase [Candidatus Krumholzibacteria bacterium]